MCRVPALHFYDLFPGLEHMVRSRLLLLMLVSTLVPVTACSTSTDSNSVTVQVLDNAFEPGNVNITLGMRVNFVWNGQAPHDVVFPPGSGIPSSAVQTSGTHDVTPSAAGTFSFLCTLHAGMTGTLTVR